MSQQTSGSQPVCNSRKAPVQTLINLAECLQSLNVTSNSVKTPKNVPRLTATAPRLTATVPLDCVTGAEGHLGSNLSSFPVKPNKTTGQHPVVRPKGLFVQPASTHPAQVPVNSSHVGKTPKLSPGIRQKCEKFLGAFQTKAVHSSTNKVMVSSPTSPRPAFREKPLVDYNKKPSLLNPSTLIPDVPSSPTFHHSSLSTPVQALSTAVSNSTSKSVPTLCFAKTLTPFLGSSSMASTQISSSVTHGQLESFNPLDEQVLYRQEAKRESQKYVLSGSYDNAPPLNAAELVDSSLSDSDSFDEFSDDEPHKESGCSQNGDSSGRSDAGRRHRVAKELLQTEEDYVSRLHLLHHVFFFRLDSENRQQTFLPPDVLKLVFCNVETIYGFHHVLLQQLRKRLHNWNENPKIGDLMKHHAPFLKMYTDYIRNFDNALKQIDYWMKKSSRFAEIIQDVQKLPECLSLSLQHHMLGPIQRIPRYELLLKEYVKFLPPDSSDKLDATGALDLVTEAARRSNEAMAKIETFHKLLDIYQSLRGVAIDFISPTREFVTQGPVIKVSARSGERQPRQLFLFSDLILVCHQNKNLLGTYSVRWQLEVDGMELKPGTSMHIPNSFSVHSKQKVVELLDENPTAEPFGWQQQIQSVIARYKERKKSLKQEESGDSTVDTNVVPESCLGKTAPAWMQDSSASMCLVCMQSFNMVRRRHHCRACGKLICKSCSKKAPLEYKKGKLCRVCVACYNVVVNKRVVSSGGDTSPRRGILHVNASEPSLIAGYLRCSQDGGHTWQPLWISAHDDFVLYFFKAHADVSALNSLPLPGHQVVPVDNIDAKPHVFCIQHKNTRVGLYQTENEKQLKKWISVLEKLVRAELPDESARLSSQSTSSSGSSTSDSSATSHSDQRPPTTTDVCPNTPHHQSDTLQRPRPLTDLSHLSLKDCSILTLDITQHEINTDNADGLSQYDNLDGVCE